MKSETRNSKLETPQLHSALTPSELAALLGPRAESINVPVPVVIAKPMTQWTSFAEEFARRLTLRLRPLIRAAARVTFREGRTVTAETLNETLDSSIAIRFWQSNRSIEPLAAAISNPLVATFVDRLLGSHAVPNGDEIDLHRPLTDVDTRLASRLIDAVQESVSESAATNDSQIATEPSTAPRSFAEAWLSESVLLRLTFELQFVQGGGALDLLIPLEIAETFSDESIDSESPSATTENLPLAQPVAKPSNSTSRHSKIVAQLAQTSLTRSALESLDIGDILLTGESSEHQLRITIDGQPRFLATAGTIDGHKAVRMSTEDPC